VQRLETAGKALRQSALDQQRRRPQKHDMQARCRSRILVPQALGDFGPAVHLLDFVDDQDRAVRFVAAREPACFIPLRVQPGGAPQGRFVRRGVDAGASQGVEDLAHHRCLADLAGTGDDLDEVPGFAQATGEVVGALAAEGGVF